MSATIAERLIDRRAISDRQTGNDCYIFDQIVEVDSANDSTGFILIDSLMILSVYLAPVAAFVYLVAPVVARLLSMPISD
jgi:hypothetical protein